MSLNNMGLGFTVTAKDAASSVFKGVGGSLGEMKQDAEKASTSIREVSGELKRMGVALMGVGTAGLGGLGYAAHTAATFEKSISEVSTLVDEAIFPVDKMYDITQKLGQTYGGDINQQAKALYQTISSGVTDAAEATKLLETANKLAIGGVTDTFTAVDVLTSVTAAYGRETLSAAKASDILFTTVRLGKTTASELGAHLGQVAPTASAVGMKFDELSAAIASITVQGINTAETITGLKAALANIIKPTSEAEQEAARLGIKFTAAELRSKGFKTFLDQITHSAKFNKDSMSKLFGSIEGLNAITALTANNSATFADNLKQMAAAGGATDAAFAKMSETFDFQSKVLKSKLQVALVRIGDLLLPMLTRAAKFVGGLVDKFNDLPSGVQRVIVGFFAFASVGALLFGALLVVAGAIMGVAAAGETMLVVAAVIGGLFFQVVLPAVAAATLAFYGFKDAYEKNLGGFRDFIQGVVAKVQLAWEGLQQLFTDGGFSGSVRDELNKAENSGLKDFLVTIFMWGARIGNFFDGLSKGFTNTMDSLAPVFAELRAAFNQLVEAFGFKKDGPDEAASKFAKFGEVGVQVGTVLAKVFGYLVQGISAVVNYMSGLVAGFRASGAIDAFSSALSEVWNSLMLIWNAITNVTGAVSSGGNGFRSFGEIVGYVVGKIVTVVATVISAFAGVIRVVAVVVGTVGGLLAGLWLRLQGIFNLIKGLLTGDMSLAWYGFKQIVYGTIVSVISIVAGMFESLATLVDSIGKKIGKDFGLQKSVQDFKGGMLDGIKHDMGLDQPPPGTPAATPAGGAPAPATTPGAAPPAPVPNAALPPAATPGGAGVAAPGGFDPQALAAAMPAAKPSEVNLNQTIQLTVDGAKLAEVVNKAKSSDTNRSFGATPPPT